MPSTSFSASGSYFTWKSSLAQSVDLGIAYAYGGRVLAGEDKEILVQVMGTNEKVAFSLNSSSLEQKELVFLFGWNEEFFRFGAGIGTLQIVGKLPEAKTLETNSRVASGFLGFNLPLVKGADAFLDSRVDYPFETKEATKQTAKVGLKILGNIGTSFELSRNSFELVTGLSYAKQTLSLDGAGTGEVVVSPRIGFVWSLGI